MEAEEESSLKRLVKIMKTNGDGVSRDGEENFICEVSLRRDAAVAAAPPPQQQVLSLETEGSLRHARPRGN